MINLALGRRALGKTTLVYFMASQCAYRIVLDPRGMIRSTNMVRVVTVDEFWNAMSLMHDREGEHHIHEIVWTPRENLHVALDEASAAVTSWFERYDGQRERRLFFLIDEARFFRNLETSQPLDYVLRASPQNLIDVAITAHRPKDIPTDIRAIGDYWLMFKHTQAHDLKVIEERCGESVSKQVADLDKYQFIQWDDGAAVARAYRDPSKWFVTLNNGRSLPGPDLLIGGESVELVDRNKLF